MLSSLHFLHNNHQQTVIQSWNISILPLWLLHHSSPSVDHTFSWCPELPHYGLRKWYSEIQDVWLQSWYVRLDQFSPPSGILNYSSWWYFATTRWTYDWIISTLRIVRSYHTFCLSMINPKYYVMHIGLHPAFDFASITLSLSRYLRLSW